MHEQLEELVADRDRMAELLQVVIEIGPIVDLDWTLRRIVDAALRVTGARYGAIGVWGPDGMLESFVHSGLDAETTSRIGGLPVGKGLLGAMRDNASPSAGPLRLNNLREHPDAVGFPEHHPPMQAFLGMPISIRESVYGGLYVTDDRPHFEFSAADEVTIRALASTASVAIDNARLFERVKASARWTEASRAITAALLSDNHRMRPLQLIAQRAMELTDAEQAIVLGAVEPDDPDGTVESLVISAAVGRYADDVLGQIVPIDESTTGEAYRSGKPQLTEKFRRPIQAFTDVGERPAIVMPLRAENVTLGVIALARSASQPPFDATYLDLVSDFADHAAIALTLAAARDRAEQLSVLADRDRIARDMHDQIIQRIFAVGLDLQGLAGRIHSTEIGRRLAGCINDLQDIIDDVRRTIFDLQHVQHSQRALSQRIRDAVGRLTEHRDIMTSVRLSGPVNVVANELADDVEAVVVEAVSNALRHSEAATVIIDVAVGDELTLNIVDDGRGIPTDNRRHSGLANMACRAERHGGRCTVSSPAGGGTLVSWTAPI
ncbi:histidine kinase [Mycolicibacterium agri]|nr:GAF domain-containing protein [Mycolicibacterium agri]PEG33805.1 histidine kinase [Mycolicibacterium agri]